MAGLRQGWRLLSDSDATFIVAASEERALGKDEHDSLLWCCFERCEGEAGEVAFQLSGWLTDDESAEDWVDGRDDLLIKRNQSLTPVSAVFDTEVSRGSV